MISPSREEVIFSLLFIGSIGIITLNKILSHANISQRIYRSLMRKYTSLLLGLTIALIYKFSILSGAPPIKEVYRILPNGSLTFKAPNRTFNNSDIPISVKPVIFITTTDYSPIQTSILTRLAQALYPVKDVVQWIVVSLPIETSRGFRDQIDVSPEQKSTFEEAIMENPELATIHHRNLHKLLSRFGIPYVLLNSNKLVKTFWGGGWSSPVEAENRINQGYQSGLFWAVKYLTEGVILVGNEHFTYNSMLFREVTQTKIASCWPIGLHPIRKSQIKLLFDEKSLQNLSVVGYNDEIADRFGSIMIERGGFAMDLHYLRDNIPFSGHWKLASDRQFTTADFKLRLADIQVITNRAGDETDDDSKILVWRTYSFHPKWPKKMFIKSLHSENISSNNINILLENVYGPRFYLMKNLIPKAKNTTVKYLHV